MRRAVNNESTIIGLSSVIAETHATSGPASFYRHLGVHLVKGIYSDRLFVDLGNKLVALAEQAYGLRQLDKLGELSKVLLTLPLPRQYASAARYFRGLELIRRGELDAAEAVFKSVLADPPHRYTSRALQSLGAVFTFRGDFESALKLQIEAGDRAAGKGSVDLLTQLFVQRNIAVLKSVQGDHRCALSDLQRMLPLTKVIAAVHPPVYYDYLNSLAVELGENGRLEEAAHISRTVISTPFLIAYPEWRHTFDEIAGKLRKRVTRSAVSVRESCGSNPPHETAGRGASNLFRLPAVKRSSTSLLDRERAQSTRARILNFRQLKPIVRASSHTLPQGVAPVQRNRMTIGEKLIRLMDLISHDETDDETIDKILEVVEQIVPKRRGENLH